MVNGCDNGEGIKSFDKRVNRMKDDLGNRMKKNYEDRSRFYLTRRTPVIIRLDGKAFHTFTEKMEIPFSIKLKSAMISVSCALMSGIQGAKIAYQQSDEISILVTDFDKLTSGAWFDYNIQKISSISASIATAEFNRVIDEVKNAMFDSRCFNIPREEVSNYFLWRYNDWRRNSIQLLAQSFFSHKELHGKNTKELNDMCYEKGSKWSELDPMWRNGTFLFNTESGIERVDNFIFPKDRYKIEKILFKLEE